MGAKDSYRINRIKDLLADLRMDEVTLGEVFAELETKKMSDVAQSYLDLVKLLQQIKKITYC